MYALRGVAISLAIFVLAYMVCRATVACAWWLRAGRKGRNRNTVGPNVLYALQIAPFLTSVLTVLVFAIPAFLRFEPRGASEEFGAPVTLLSLGCLLLLGTGIVRAARSYRDTVRLVSQWKHDAVPVTGSTLPICQTGPEAPPLVVAGMLRPKLFISSSTSGLLSEEELARAIAHESAHIRSHDNLKKLSLRLCNFPSFTSLERAWLGALELAADQSAVSNRREALDLASALVKSSRLAIPTPEFVTNLATPAGELLSARVERLLAWDQELRPASAPYLQSLVLGAAGIAVMLAISRYDLLLSVTHELAEVLMR